MMIVDVVKSWFFELASLPDLSAYVAIAIVVLFVSWLASTLSGRRAHRRADRQIRDLEQRIVMMEARRERDLLKTARLPAADVEPLPATERR